MKVERSFALKLVDNPNDEMIVRSTIELAHDMALAVMAEGVGAEAGLERLRGPGCDFAQDHLISTPILVDGLKNRSGARTGP